jgi:hypothetical protein
MSVAVLFKLISFQSRAMGRGKSGCIGMVLVKSGKSSHLCSSSWRLCQSNAFPV